MVVRGSTHRTLTRPPRGMRKRSRAPTPTSVRKRARTSSKKRRAAPKRAYAGPLIASKPVRLAKTGARVRQRQFGQVSPMNRVWLGSKSTGSEWYFTSLIAESLVNYLFRSLRNTIADKDTQAGASFLGRVNIRFTRSSAVVSPDPVAVNVQMLTVDNSFNGLVYNTSASPNVVTKAGVTVAYAGVNQILWEMARDGYYPTGIMAWRHTTESASEYIEVFRDEALDRANIKLQVDGTHKYQNVTPADDLNSARFNANAIDANPLEGKIYTFRNQQPVWSPSWLLNQTGSTLDLQRNVARPYIWNAVQGGDTNYPGIVRTNLASFPQLTELAAPPLRPTTLFSNVAKTGKVYLPPGGFKVFKTQFTFDGTFRRLIQDLIQVSTVSQDIVGKVPPLGGSFLLCVIPTLKTIEDDLVHVAFDYQKDGQAFITKFRAGTMPTSNFMQ